MAVFRIEKTRDYTVMSNHHLKDRTLTLKSKGLLSMMLSLPDEWNYTTRGLAAICREGVDSIGAALKELETHGYIRRTQLRDEKGKITDTVNTKVGEIAGEVGQTPLAWNSGVFSMIRNLSETVIVPIAGVILTFVMCYELIQLVTEKNNLHDVDTWMFFKWIFKTFCAVLIVTNTWNIVMGIFDVGQSVVNSSAGVIIGNTSIDISSVITDMEAQLEALGTGELFGLWFQSLFVGLTMNALSICIMLVIYGRMIEVYLTTSVGPIPLATMTNRDWSHTGQNYLKSLFALAFQAFLIMVCVGIYSVLVQSIATDGNISGAIWACMGYTVLLCFALFKTGSLSKSLFGAH